MHSILSVIQKRKRERKGTLNYKTSIHPFFNIIMKLCQNLSIKNLKQNEEEEEKKRRDETKSVSF